MLLLIIHGCEDSVIGVVNTTASGIRYKMYPDFEKLTYRNFLYKFIFIPFKLFKIVLEEILDNLFLVEIKSIEQYKSMSK